MTERNIAAEVLDGLREVREHRAGKRILKAIRVEPRPLAKLTPEVIRSARDRPGVSRAVFAHMVRVPVRTVERWEQGRSSSPRIGRGPHPHGAEVPGHVRPHGVPVTCPTPHPAQTPAETMTAGQLPSASRSFRDRTLELRCGWSSPSATSKATDAPCRNGRERLACRARQQRRFSGLIEREEPPLSGSGDAGR